MSMEWTCLFEFHCSEIRRRCSRWEMCSKNTVIRVKWHPGQRSHFIKDGGTSSVKTAAAFFWLSSACKQPITRPIHGRIDREIFKIDIRLRNLDVRADRIRIAERFCDVITSYHKVLDEEH